MIVNLTNKKYIAYRPFFAYRFYDRLRGMIGRKFHEAGFDAMVFGHCNCIHTMFMGHRIDVIFIDGENKVVGLRKNLARWLPCVSCAKAARVIELPVGVIEYTETEIGHILNVSEETVPELNNKVTDDKNIISGIESVVRFKESGK
jgi:uncharacterized membrane protein (UPF0127 family)